METSDWLIVGVLGLVVIIGAVALSYSVWFSDVPKDFYLDYMLKQTSEEVFAKLPKFDDDFIQAGFSPLQGDPKRKVLDAIQRRLRASGKYRGPDTDYFVEQMVQEFPDAAPLVMNDEQAKTVGKKLGLQTVAFGEGKIKEDDAETVVEANLTLIESKEGKPMAEAKVTRRLHKSFFSLEYYRLRLGETSAILRILFWFVLSAGLPFFFYPLLLLIFQKDSNSLNLGVLIAFTVLCFIFALGLNGLAFSGIWIILYIGILAAAFFYHLAIMNALQEAD